VSFCMIDASVISSEYAVCISCYCLSCGWLFYDWAGYSLHRYIPLLPSI